MLNIFIQLSIILSLFSVTLSQWAETQHIPSVPSLRRSGRRKTGAVQQLIRDNNNILREVAPQPFTLTQAQIPSESSSNIPQPPPAIRPDVSDIGGKIPEMPELKPEEKPIFDQDELVLPQELLPTPPIIELPPVHKERVIEFNFENADLTFVIKQIQELFNVTFITDDMIEPLPKGSRAIKGNTISFKTSEPLTRNEAWDLFLKFLDLAQFTLVPDATAPGLYRIKPIPNATKSPIPAYIGVDYTALPDNDQLIRYAYFVQNSPLETIYNVVDKLRGSGSELIQLNENRAILITDKAYNIKTLMQIIKELDQVTMPQAMSILKLRHAEAKAVADLYESITKTGEQPGARPFQTRKAPSSLYFPENARIIAEPRTNSLILLGQKDAIEKIEQFVIKHVDISLDQPYSPLHVIQLNFASAKTVADIMTNVVQFGRSTNVGKFGGVRNADKFLGDMSFTAEESTNRIIIKGSHDDFLKARDIIQKLDEQQPQVAVEALILTVNSEEATALGIQLRNKKPGVDGLIGPNVDFQTSGSFTGAGDTAQGIVQRTTGNGAERLLGNLLNLITNTGPGNTIVTLGRDAFGVWGLLQILKRLTSLQVISNPFVIATNKTPAEVSVGEARRIPSGLIVPGGGSSDVTTFDNDSANISLTFVPQINSDGMIILDIQVMFSEYLNPISNTLETAEKRLRIFNTQVVTANKQVIGIGGLVRSNVRTSMSKVPILGDIPVIGWLFKNKLKSVANDNLLVLISTRIIRPEATEEVNKFTQERINEYHGTLSEMMDIVERRDPIHKFMFEPKESEFEKMIDNLIFDRREKNQNSPRKRRRRRNAELTKKKETQQKQPDIVIAQKPPTQQAVSAPPPPSPTLAQTKVSQTTVPAEPRKKRNSLVAMTQSQSGKAA